MTMSDDLVAGEVDGISIRREWIFQGTHLRAYCDNPSCGRARANFDHRRLGRTDFDEPQLFAGVVRHGYASLVIQSRQNDYYQNPDLPAMRRVLSAYVARFHDVSAMGFSMGGFAALLLSRALNLSHVWLVSPMSVTFPKTPPFLTDLATEMTVFDQADPEDLAGVKADMRGVVLFDPYFEEGRDACYANLVQRLCPTVSLLAMPWGGHPATQFLSEAKHYSPMQRATFKPEIRAHVLKNVQRKFRLDCPMYTLAAQGFLMRRAARDDRD